MTLNRLLTASAALLVGLAPLAAQAQTPKTEKAAAAATGKPSTDAPAATASQGTAKAVKEGVAPAATAAAPATPAAPSVAAGPKVVPNGDIVQTLRLSGQFTTFVKGLDATNLSGLLSKNPNLTVFAPTDAAFATLPPGQLDKLMADKPALQKLLTHHVINAPVDSTKIKGAKGPVPSVAGDAIELDGSEDVLKADNANIVQADVRAANGILHVVDHVMIAGSVPPTTAAPAAPATGAPASATTTTTTTTTTPPPKK